MQGYITNGLLGGTTGVILGQFYLGFVDVVIDLPPPPGDKDPTSGSGLRYSAGAHPGVYWPRSEDHEVRPARLHFILTLNGHTHKTTFNVTEKNARTLMKGFKFIDRTRESVSITVKNYVVNPVKNLVKLTWKDK